MKFAIIKSCLARFSGIFAVGTPSYIHGTAISYRCAKFGAFVNSVTILTLRDLTNSSREASLWFCCARRIASVVRFWVRSFEMIRIRISDQMNRWIHSGQGFIGSIDVPSDPSDLGSLILILILIRIIPKERARLISFYRFSIRSCLTTVYNLRGTLKLDLPRVTSTSYGLQSFRCAALHEYGIRCLIT